MENFSRRNFIKTMGVVGGGLVLSSGSLLKAQEGQLKGGKKLNIALIGIGAEGRVLLESMLKLPYLNFVAVCDIWPNNLKYAFAKIFRGVKQKPARYEDYQDVIKNHAKELDAVIIATPDFWHAPHTNAFLEAGVNVYCEKMMSDTIEGAKSMVRAMRKSGKLLQIGHQRKSNPRYIYAHDVLLRKNNICGKIMACNGQWNRAVTKDITANEKIWIPQDKLEKYGYKDMHQFLNWRWFKGKGGGAISDLGAHQIDIFGWMLGTRPTSVMASGNNEYYKHDWSDNVMCIFEYDKSFQGNSVQAFYQVLTTTSSGGGYFESFMGDKGTLKMSENASITKLFKENSVPKEEWDALTNMGVIGKGGGVEAVKKADVRESGPLASFEFPAKVPNMVEGKPIHSYHLENFFGAVKGENKLSCDAAHAFEAEAAVFKAREAIEARKTLAFQESDFVVD